MHTYTEYGCKWKVMHYYAKRLFSPKLIIPELVDSTIYMYLHNENVSDSSLCLSNTRYLIYLSQQCAFNIYLTSIFNSKSLDT